MELGCFGVLVPALTAILSILVPLLSAVRSSAYVADPWLLKTRFMIKIVFASQSKKIVKARQLSWRKSKLKTHSGHHPCLVPVISCYFHITTCFSLSSCVEAGPTMQIKCPAKMIKFAIRVFCSGNKRSEAGFKPREQLNYISELVLQQLVKTTLFAKIRLAQL